MDNAWQKLKKWWRLDNVNSAAGLLFGLVGALAGLAAANFFFFSAHFARPLVAPGVIMDAAKVSAPYRNSVPAVVQNVVRKFTSDSLSDRGVYDAGPALIRDCDLYHQDIDQVVAATACETVDATTVEYPRYLHELITTNGTFNPGELQRYLEALAASRAPGDTPATPRNLPAEQRILSGDALTFAAKTLQDAAVPVDIVTVKNNGHADAVNVQVSTPTGLQTLDGSAAFDISAESSKTIIYRRATSVSSQTAVSAFEPLPIEGFEVTASTTDTFLSRTLGLILMVLFGAIFVATIIRDIWCTDVSAKPRATP